MQGRPPYPPQQQMPNGAYPPNMQRPPMPQGDAAAKKKSNLGVILGIIGGVLGLLVIAVIVLVIAFSKSGDTTTVTPNVSGAVFQMTEFESEFDTIEEPYLDNNGDVKDDKIDVVLEEEHNYLVNYDGIYDLFSSFSINQKKHIIECVLNNGNIYEHYPGKNTPSRVVDENDTVIEEETTEETTEKPTEEATEEADTTPKTGNYANFEKMLVKKAPDIVGCCMEFRGVDGKIYYYDHDYQPTGIYSYDFTNDKINKEFNIKSAKELGLTNYVMCLVSLGEKGCMIYQYCEDNDFQTVEGSEHKSGYAYDGTDISKNVNLYTGEFDGDYLYCYDGYSEPVNQIDAVSVNSNGEGNSDIVFVAERDLPDLGDNYHLAKVFTSDGNMFGVFNPDDNSQSKLVKLEGEKSEILFDFDGVYYIDDGKFYFMDDGMLKCMDTTGSDYTAEDVIGIDCDVLYCVTPDRAYFCKRINDGQKAVISYVDLDTNKVTEIYSGNYAMGGY